MTNPDWTLIGVTIVAFGIGYWAISWLFDHLPKSDKPPAGNKTASGQKTAPNPSPPPEPAPEETRQDTTSHAESLPSDEAKHGAVLGLKGQVSPAEIKQAYREQLTKYHPDKVHHLGAEFHRLAEVRTKEIVAAYEYFRNKYNLD